MQLQGPGSFLCAFVLATALGIAGEAAAQSYFATWSGAPSSITCTTTSISWNAQGLSASWNLPPASQLHTVEMVGALVVDDSKIIVGGPDLPASGSITDPTDDLSWPTPVPLPYTYTNSATPLYPGAGTSRISFDCVGGVGTNFRISNAPPFGFAPVGGVWWDPDQSGSGYGLDYDAKTGILLVQAYSYLESGAAQWYLVSAIMTGNVAQGALVKYVGGQCISCAWRGNTIAGSDGTMTITFTSPTTADVTLPGGRQTKIERYFVP